MFKIGWKAAELKRVKFQSGMQKERIEFRRRKRLENRLKMAKGKVGAAKNPKQSKEEEQEKEEIVEDLEDPGKRKGKTLSLYAAMELGQFVTKGKGRKERSPNQIQKLHSSLM